MLFKETILKGNFVIDLSIKEDERGFFSRYFCKKEFSDYGLNTEWVQINNIFSKELGTLRGLHFQQAPKAEVKLVRCIKGSIWDVVVDLRSDSETFGKWFGATLSEENRTMMYAPKGFAHGFISLSDVVEVEYKCTDIYHPEDEECLIWSDKKLDIKWPIQNPILSKKDLLGK